MSEFVIVFQGKNEKLDYSSIEMLEKFLEFKSDYYKPLNLNRFSTLHRACKRGNYVYIVSYTRDLDDKYRRIPLVVFINIKSLGGSLDNFNKRLSNFIQENSINIDLDKLIYDIDKLIEMEFRRRKLRNIIIGFLIVFMLYLAFRTWRLL